MPDTLPPATQEKIARLRTLMLNRREMAERWHGLTEWWQIVAFAIDDPEVRALMRDPALKRELQRVLMARLSNADVASLQELGKPPP